MMRLGAHNSIAGGLHNAVAECVSIGGDAMQIFCKNQRQWTAKPMTEQEAKTFRDAVAAAKIGPNMVHGSYLVNLGNADAAKAKQSLVACADEYQRSEALGIAYFNIHPGSHGNDDRHKRDDRAERDAALDRIADNLAAILDVTKGFGCRLVLENAAGQGTNVGNTWEEVGRILDAVGQKKRMGVTIDTQHSWACGYDWRERYDETWDAFETAVGRDHQLAFHLNDSKTELGARVDRHDTIGSGLLGLETFAHFINDRKNDGKVGFLETPDGLDSWKLELATLRGLRTDKEAPRAKATPRAGLPAAKKGKQATL